MSFAVYERFTDPAKKVLELAAREADRLNHQYVGTEHLLLGLVYQQNGLHVRLLEGLAVKAADLRQEVMQRLGKRN